MYSFVADERLIKANKLTLIGYTRGEVFSLIVIKNSQPERKEVSLPNASPGNREARSK